MLARLTDIDWEHWQARERATLLFVIRGGEILLIRKLRGLGAGKINGPGGRIDPGETPMEGAIREVEEELRVIPLGVEPRGELRFHFADGHSIHGFVFSARDCRGAPQSTLEAIPLWTPIDRIPWDEMWADDRHWLPLLLAGDDVDGRFLFDGDALLDHSVARRSRGVPAVPSAQAG
jgi:8-oxo-dGTP diphosphatase